MSGFSGSTGVPLKQMQDAIAQSTARMNNYNFGSKTVAQFKAELITYAATLGYRDYRHISVEISAAADGFVASTYVGTLQKTSSDTRFIVTLNNAYEPAPADMILIYKDGTWTQGGIAQSTAKTAFSLSMPSGWSDNNIDTYIYGRAVIMSGRFDLTTPSTVNTFTLTDVLPASVAPDYAVHISAFDNSADTPIHGIIPKNSRSIVFYRNETTSLSAISFTCVYFI